MLGEGVLLLDQGLAGVGRGKHEEQAMLPLVILDAKIDGICGRRGHGESGHQQEGSNEEESGHCVEGDIWKPRDTVYVPNPVRRFPPGATVL
jgi:hypothetical protein